MATTKETYYIYIDSDHVENTVVPEDPEFKFSIQPCIQTQPGESCSLFVKDFTHMNNFYNVTDLNKINSIVYIDPVTDEHREVYIHLTNGHYHSGEEIVTHIREIFLEQIKLKFANPTDIPAVECTFHKQTLKCKFRFTGYKLKFIGPVFSRILNFDESKTYIDGDAKSSYQVDVTRNIHNLYVSIAEVNHAKTLNVSSALNMPNRVCKIPIVSPFGGYCVYQSSVNPQRTKISNHIINNLTFKLFLDDGSTISTNKFTCTIVLEIDRPVIKPAHPIQDMPNGYYSTSASIPFLHKPVHRRC